MKKAKIILAAAAILAVVGGAFAFRASRFPPSVYSNIGTTLTTTIVGGQIYSTTVPRCFLLPLATTNVGVPTTIYSTTGQSTTVFTRQGGQQVIGTYLACFPTTLITTTVD